MRKGMSHIRKRDNVLNSIYPKDIIEKDGYVLVTARVKDISEKEVKRDQEWELMQSKTAQSLRRSANGGDRVMSNPEQLNQWLNDAQRLNTTIISPPVADIRTPGVSLQVLPAFSNLSPPNLGAPALSPPSADPPQNFFPYMAQRRQSYRNRAEKLVYWIVDDSGYCKKYGIIDDKTFNIKDTIVLQLLSYPLLQDKQYLSFSGRDPISPRVHLTQYFVWIKGIMRTGGFPSIIKMIRYYTCLSRMKMASTQDCQKTTRRGNMG
jgi:hypothetical protein